MPLILKIDSYRVYFWSNEGDPLEPVHVHVSEGRPTTSATKIWIMTTGECRLCNNNSRIPERALNNIMRILEAYHQEIADAWNRYFYV
ncbi:MAG: DUF4160 domain-containing protein [Eubacteriales bacterium]|nr:DUF4160 domain-containing protein [Eubacteriales bacterium]